MGKIVAVGGGDIRLQETATIDREIVRLTGCRHPRALFIPTASADSRDYWEAFHNLYEDRLGCRADVLYLLGEKPSRRRIADAVSSAQLIYVGGGNTLKMMRRWRLLGVDRLLLQAFRRGTVLSGLSAGCICWFSWGHSDSMSFYHPEDWDYIRVRGLGLIDALGCPHYDGERRDRNFEAMIARTGDRGIALDNCCALEIVDGRYRIITSRPGAGAYRVTRRKGQIVTEEISRRKSFASLTDLLT